MHLPLHALTSSIRTHERKYKSIWEPDVIKSLTSCHVSPAVVFLRHLGPPRFSRAMSSQSHSKDTKHPRFGHLPLSTSGPEQCALTVINFSSVSALALGLTNYRAQHSSALRITTKGPHSLRMNVGISSSTVCCPQMCKLWMNKSNVHMNSIAKGRVPLVRIPS